MLDTLLGHPITLRLGWTLSHSLWQGLALWGLFGLGLLLLGAHRASARHALATATLLLWLAAPAATFSALTPPVVGTAQTVRLEPAVPPLAPRASAEEPEGFGSPTPQGGRAAVISQVTANELRRLIPYATLAWLTVASLLTLRLFGGLNASRRLARTGTPLPSLEATFRHLVARLGISRRVRLLASHRVDVPSALGWLQPVVLLPTSAITGLSTAQLELILAHELAHVRRHDYLVNLLQGVSEALLFYHPLTWWISRSLRVEREHACDDMALDVTGAEPLALAECLTRLEAGRALPAPALTAGNYLLLRIRRLLGSDRATPPRQPVLPTLLALALLASWFTLSAQASAPDGTLFKRHPGGAIANPYPEPPEGGWETFMSLTDLEARTTYPLVAATVLPAGFRFSNATWDGRVALATITYVATDSVGSEPPQALTLVLVPTSTYHPLPIGLQAMPEHVTVGAAVAEYVTGHWEGDWRAPPAERDLRWLSETNQTLAWREGDLVYVLALDQPPQPRPQPISLDELVQVAEGLVTITPARGIPDARQPLPTDRTRLWATLRGEVTMGADLSGPECLAAGCSLIIEERSRSLARRVIVTPTGDGDHGYDYTVNQAPAVFDAEAADWYRQVLETAFVTPLRALDADPTLDSYYYLSEAGDRYVSLISSRSQRNYRVYLPGAVGSPPQHLTAASLDLLAHAAAHGVTDQGTLEVALYSYLAEATFDTDQEAAFQYAVAQIDSNVVRQRLLARMD